ncbi:DNA topoisomerase IB [Sesbania bispinosa]|nr:DNA topoisomerase IB [Sesbania bispinosa]
MPPKKTKGIKTKEEELAIFGEMEARMEMIEGEITNRKTTMEAMRIQAEASRLQAEENHAKALGAIPRGRLMNVARAIEMEIGNK